MLTDIGVKRNMCWKVDVPIAVCIHLPPSFAVTPQESHRVKLAAKPTHLSSKSGGNASEVDGTGPANVAQAIVNAGGDTRFVLISALALDRPDSKSYQITNTMGGFIDKIMDEKLRGEEAVRTIMNGGTKGGGKGPGNYVIIRPGPLLSGKSKNGASDLELNQGDTVGGGLSRDELAGIVVGALQAGEIARGSTVECYRSRTATALQPEFALPSG